MNTENQSATDGIYGMLPVDPFDEFKDKVRAEALSVVKSGCATAEWANGHLIALGIKPLAATNVYTFQVPVILTAEAEVRAANRTDALDRAAQLVNYSTEKGRLGDFYSRSFQADGAPVIVEGPEDHDEDAPIPAGAPTTLEEMKKAVRSIIINSVVGEPNFDHYNAKDVLARLGLDPMGTQKTFRVEVPVTAVHVVEVAAYDQDSALAAAKAHQVTRQSQRLGRQVVSGGRFADPEFDTSKAVAQVK